MSKWEPNIEKLTAEKAFACKVVERRYSCMYCNKGWRLTDPGFVYYRAFSQTHWMVKAGIARVGDPMNVLDANNEFMHTSGWDSLGSFARCADRDACARRRRNLHNGVQHEHLSFLDEIDRRRDEMAATKEAMV